MECNPIFLRKYQLYLSQVQELVNNLEQKRIDPYDINVIKLHYNAQFFFNNDHDLDFISPDKLKIKNSIYCVNYKSVTSYRLRIYRKENLIKFKELIGFKHPLKQGKLREAIRSYKK